MFPKVLDIELFSTRDELNVIVSEFQKICSLMHRNISTRDTKEYLFEKYDGQSVIIIAGSGSAEKYRDNFIKRLAENFHNLKWIYDNYPDKKKHEIKKNLIAEFKIYEDTYIGILSLYPSIPTYLKDIYEKLKNTLFHDSE